MTACRPSRMSAKLRGNNGKTMNYNKPFSVRYGIQPERSPMAQEAPKELRYFILKYFKGEFSYPWECAEFLEDFLRSPGLATRFANPHDPQGWPKFHRFIEDFEWWQVYDFLEFCYQNPLVPVRREFALLFNEEFSRENIPYRFDSNGEIVYKGSEAFEVAVATAESVLAATGRITARDEIHKALKALSIRPTPDLTGAVQHAVAGLECVANDVSGETGETLGQIVKKHPDKFPPPLGEGVSKLYGFASQKGRHILEGAEPDLKEAELVVGIAAIVATYLSK
jgi:hypothetical protein